MMLLEGLLLNVTGDFPDTHRMVEDHTSIMGDEDLPFQEKEYSERVLYFYNQGTGTFRDRIDISSVFDKIEMTKKFAI